MTKFDLASDRIMRMKRRGSKSIGGCITPDTQRFKCVLCKNNKQDTRFSKANIEAGNYMCAMCERAHLKVSCIECGREKPGNKFSKKMFFSKDPLCYSCQVRSTREKREAMAGYVKKTFIRRKCLKCEKNFDAVAANRICDVCKDSPTWKAGITLY